MGFFDLRAIAAVAVVALILGGLTTFGDLSKLSLASGQDNTLTEDIQGASFDLYTGSSWTPFADYPETFNFYGQQVRIENHANSAGNTEDIGTIHIGDKSKTVDLDGSFKANGVKVTVSRGVDTQLYDGRPYSQEYDNYLALGGDVTVTIPKESIQADIHDFDLEKTGPGRRKVSFNVSLTNDWHRLAVDKVRVEAFGKSHDLAAGPYLDEGTSTYSVVGSFSEYDVSQYRVNETVNKTIQVHVENPRIPATEKSFTGAKSIENPDFGFPDFKTEKAWFTADIRYCGEAAEYVDGECVIDEDLHLRGDTCFLPQNYTIVTETFSPGSYDRNDVVPEASYFCSRHPVIVTASGVQTDRIISPYQKLVNDKSFTVPDGQTYTMFWVVNSNRVDVTRVCEEGTLNKTTGNCQVVPGVVHKCSSGVWSPEQGACVVNPDTKTICSNPDARYNKDLEVCVFNPPTEASCSKGEYDVESEQCIYTPDTKISCDKGEYNRNLDKCVYTPESEADCEIGEYDSEAGKCLYSPSTAVQCEKGEYEASHSQCVYEPPVKTSCPAGSQLGQDGMCYSEASVKKVCPEDVNGTIQGGHCTVDAVTLVKTGFMYDLRNLWFDLQNWVDDNVADPVF